MGAIQIDICVYVRMYVPTYVNTYVHTVVYIRTYVRSLCRICTYVRAYFNTYVLGSLYRCKCFCSIRAGKQHTYIITYILVLVYVVYMCACGMCVVCNAHMFGCSVVCI